MLTLYIHSDSVYMYLSGLQKEEEKTDVMKRKLWIKHYDTRRWTCERMNMTHTYWHKHTYTDTYNYVETYTIIYIYHTMIYIIKKLSIFHAYFLKKWFIIIVWCGSYKFVIKISVSKEFNQTINTIEKHVR